MRIEYVVIYDDLLFHLSSSTALYSLLFDANSMHEKKIEIMLFSMFKRHSDAK